MDYEKGERQSHRSDIFYQNVGIQGHVS